MYKLTFETLQSGLPFCHVTMEKDGRLIRERAFPFDAKALLTEMEMNSAIDCILHEFLSEGVKLSEKPAARSRKK